MKQNQLKLWLLGILFVLILLGVVYAEEKVSPTEVTPPSNVRPASQKPTPQQMKNPQNTQPQKPNQTPVPPATNTVPGTTIVPDIPKDWGNLVSSQFLMDGAYLTFTFENKDGIY